MNTMSPQNRQRAMSVATLVGFFLLWELICRATGVSDLILPRPSQIAMVLWQKMPLLWPHTVQTLKTTLFGFALGVAVGIVIGVAIGSSKLAYDVAYPLLVGFSSIPKVAVVPIFVVWFGAGTVPAVLTSMVISIFPGGGERGHGPGQHRARAGRRCCACWARASATSCGTWACRARCPTCSRR